MCTRRTPSPAAWSEMCEAMDGVPTPSRASLVSQGKHTDVDTLKDRARLEQELESDRRFFADPPDDYVRCPTCSVVYAVHSSRPTTPSDANTGVAPMIPACYSKELPRGANLGLDEAMRHMHRSRFRCGQCDLDFCRCGVSPYHWGWSCDGWQKHQQASGQVCPVGSCRWCSQPCMAKMRRAESLASACCGDDEGNDFKRFPPSLSCAEKERRACGKRHADCGHWCGGVRGEDRCLPCLYPECSRKKAMSSSSPPTPLPPSSTQQPQSSAKLPDGDDWCPICWTEPLNAAPAIQLACGHVLHHHCAEAIVRKGHTAGRRLTFKSIRCPLCQAIMQHPSINAHVGPQFAMYQKVRRKALQRWVVEQRRPAPRSHDPVDEDRIASLAMAKMTFFECSQCNEPYYGGEIECGGAEEEEDLDEDVQAALAMELVCRGCASKGQLQCPEHGTEFLGWKCRYCCEREAHYFCFGTTHFCYVCHDLWQTGVEQRRKLQAGKPCLNKDKCIFGGRHPPGSRNGRDEYALGCTICAQDTECGILGVNRDRRAVRRKFNKHCALM
mmetsp:Transcript_33320/g.91903  ORF Transcript_33320/g.91903 Transcript_33320/m.91903 type:complete len:555 (+) Transcript_33320:140-1804(+)